MLTRGDEVIEMEFRGGMALGDEARFVESISPHCNYSPTIVTNLLYTTLFYSTRIEVHPLIVIDLA